MRTVTTILSRTSPILLFCFCAVVVSSQLDAQLRWGATATNGGGLGLGDPTTITWGFVADGTSILGGSGEPVAPSSLRSFLDTAVGPGGGGADLTNRPWYTLFVNIFDRWDSVSGLKFTYEPADSGATISNLTLAPLGSLGVNADVRIGGHFIDGQAGSNTLAYNYFPDHGDMVIDTSNTTFFGDSTDNYVGLRNVLAHEFGHGMGLPHVTATTSRQLMEAFVDTTFDGPQIDDIYEAQRRYGDNAEEAGGNNTAATAQSIGNFTGTAISIGNDANTLTAVEINPTQNDFFSIDDDSDIDFIKFTTNGTYDMTLDLNMVGPTYDHNGNGSYNLAMQSDLNLALFNFDGTSMLGQSNNVGLGVAELINIQLAAGTYLARITGVDNAAQFYRFRASGILVAVPEPSSLFALGLVGTLLLRRKRS